MAVAFVLKGYPRLSETFIAQEIRALETRGLDIRIVALRRPTDGKRHPVHDEIRAPVRYLPEYLHDEPARVARSWRALRCTPGYKAARMLFLKDLARDPTPNRIRRFGQALVLAHELPREVTRLHAHFLHTPASVTRYAATIAGLPWSASAHAKDIWTTPDWELREKLSSAAWTVTCTEAGRDRLARLGPVSLVYHGLDLARFPEGAPRGAGPRTEILSVGRAVEKKGYDDLLAALARLPHGLDWRFRHAGGGPLLPALKAQAERLGLADRIEWLGSKTQDELLSLYRDADLFVLPSRPTRSGDQDGLPNVLMEAQSQGLACIATRISGIPELIRAGETGVLVPPRDVDALARAIAELARDAPRREALARAGTARVRAHFSHDSGIALLAEKFGLLCASPSTRP